MSRPNVIFIMADQMRGDCMSCDGHPVVETPNLDHLAARGTRFPHAYTAVPSCIPARSTVMTGMDQWHTGVLGMGRGQGPIPNDFPHTLAGRSRMPDMPPTWSERGTSRRSARTWVFSRRNWTNPAG